MVAGAIATPLAGLLGWAVAAQLARRRETSDVAIVAKLVESAYDEAGSLSNAAKLLNSRGSRTKRGRDWTGSTVSKALTAPDSNQPPIAGIILVAAMPAPLFSTALMLAVVGS
jgi:hypothetical protein